MNSEKQTVRFQLTDFWKRPTTVERNNFVNKSLSSFAANVAVGCGHKCGFCYVPDASTIRMGAQLTPYGVTDPDAQWGDYVMVRPWDANAFRASVRRAMALPPATLNKDGNRAVMFCTTTDPYQVVHHPEAPRRAELNAVLQQTMRESLRILLHESDLNVRILTRSPLARQDFALMKEFGPRLLFGMSLPTLDNRLAKVYEPDAPAPSARLKCLEAAKAAGLHVYVAMAPTYPECTVQDLANTLQAVAKLDPVTIFHEPINIHADNVARLKKNADALGVPMKTEVFQSKATWTEYALNQLYAVERLCADMKLSDQLHLWPDASLGTKEVIHARGNDYATWIKSWWGRVSAWPE